jgi:hypothetical protein
MKNSQCYNFILYEYEKGIFDNFIDATYILTMVGSDRHNNISNQLSKYIPTKKIYIVENKGFKKCNKVLIKNIPPYDIKDSYFSSINHSVLQNYNNILILEDDFIFSPKVEDILIINEIDLFFLNHKNKMFYYNLGPIPSLFYPNINIFNNTFRGIFCLGAQAIIYTKKIQIDILKNIDNDELHWDVFLLH